MPPAEDFVGAAQVPSRRSGIQAPEPPRLGHEGQVSNFRLLIPVTAIARAQPLLEHGLRLGGQVLLPVLYLTEKLPEILIAGLVGILERVLSGLGAL
jgi:hypothetical protein